MQTTLTEQLIVSFLYTTNCLFTHYY